MCERLGGTLSHWRERWQRLATRHPRIRGLARWGTSAASLVSGGLTLLVFRRGLEYFPWFVGYVLLAWLAGVVLVERRRRLAARGHRAVARAVEYGVQTLLHGLLLFLLPTYYASTTLPSRNAWFLLLLAAAAVLTAIDPWYRAIARRAPWTETGLFALGLFAALQVAFPLIGVPPGWGLPSSGAACIVALAPLVPQPAARRRRLPGLTASAALVASLLWAAQAWFPPVPLHLTRAMFARDVEALEPVQPIAEITEGELATMPGVIGYSAVAAPAGLRQGLEHVWRKDGRVVARIPLAAISGGRAGGYRTFSRRSGLGVHPAGTWQLDVLTAQGQLIGRAFLRVTPGELPRPPGPPEPRS